VVVDVDGAEEGEDEEELEEDRAPNEDEVEEDEVKLGE
jgi:hypothetical protein